MNCRNLTEVNFSVHLKTEDWRRACGGGGGGGGGGAGGEDGQLLVALYLRAIKHACILVAARRRYVYLLLVMQNIVATGVVQRPMLKHHAVALQCEIATRPSYWYCC